MRLIHNTSRCIIPVTSWLFCLFLLTNCNEQVNAPVPVHEFSVPKIVLLPADNSETVYIRNIGKAPLDWSLTIDEAFIQSNINSGTVAPGDSVGVTFTATVSEIPSGTIYKATPTFHFPETFDQSLMVRVVNIIEKKWRLAESIVDAEYDRTHDVIIALTKSNKVLKINPVEKTIVEVQLDFPGVALSINPNGDHAMVGHKSAITYINLNSMTVEQVHGLSFYVFDVVLSGSNWGYVFPGKTQWTNLFCIDFTTGEQKLSWASLYSDERGKLHTKGDFIYCMSTRSSPSDLAKYDVKNGFATYLYDSPYHGNYPMGYNFWFADDGLSVFSGGGSVFTTQDISTNDLKYKGTLNLQMHELLYSLDHSSNAQRIYAVRADAFYDPEPTGKLLRYDLSYHLLGELNLEKFLLTDEYGDPTLYDGLGSFVFFNSSGAKAHIVQKADHASETWAILSLDVE